MVAIYQQIGKARRKHHRLALAAIVVVAKLNGVPVEVFAKRVRDFGAAHFGVAHLGRAIAVHRTKIPLPVDQRRAHGKILRHADQRIVHGLIAMRVVLTDHIANDPG